MYSDAQKNIALMKDCQLSYRRGSNFSPRLLFSVKSFTFTRTAFWEELIFMGFFVDTWKT